MSIFPFFFFNDTPTTEIYTLSLHDALPILSRLKSTVPLSARRTSRTVRPLLLISKFRLPRPLLNDFMGRADRNSPRLNSSHQIISSAVFCLKRKKALRVHALRVASSRGRGV